MDHAVERRKGSGPPAQEVTLGLSRPLSLRLTLGPLRFGRQDPCVRFDAAGFWWATRTPDGPATLLLQEQPNDTLKARAWGEGAKYAIDSVPELIGEHQDDADFFCDNTLVAEIHHRLRGLRVPRARHVSELLLQVILGQRVTTGEAQRSYRQIVRALREPAPGPGNLMLPPLPQQLAGKPYWWFHRFGVERKRAQTIRTTATHAKRLQETIDMNVDDAKRRLLATPGVGLWTAGLVRYYALGDPDSVAVGDLHFPDHVAWALAQEPRGDDARMLQLLEPFRGQRGRVLRLIVYGHSGPPKYGPRYSPIPIANY